MENKEFIPWNGGNEPPVRNAVFTVKYRDGRIEPDFQSEYYHSRFPDTWKHLNVPLDIVGYFVQEEYN